ncbi:hypothetical protein PR202_gb03786 [Eleusine coracana subsp. coracana]|uniref:Uncharacterized protein n=1 Tax=Eleusine coracana subsp. coracana TaxID=191504 RepID=A0AAV5E3P9_ELECO|nr:hypothetical protein QOZ80_1BG0096220 [Eleusine coracana subsp. coracana]GJN16765.1 hypothetical protein PR202_gb03786 [Eleusine coracana subsp. coracana]
MATRRGVAPVLIAALLAIIAQGARGIGVCYGVNGAPLPSAAEVVALYKSNRITSMRIYFADRAALDALRGSGIGLILDTGNDVVPEFASNPSSAASWVKDNVQAYFPDVNINYIAVGNELTGTAAASSNVLLPAMRNVHDALAAAGLAGRIKVSTAVSMDTLDEKSSPPSEGVFKDAAGVMRPIVEFLASNGSAPLLLNVYPYFAYRDNQGRIDLNYALFQPSSTTVNDPSNGLTYTNLFDAMVDAVRAALEKAGGGGGVDVVVSESGWPSADGPGATVDNARTYNQNLINHAAKGTPRKPGPMEVYVFAIFNENQKPGDPTEKKFGLFNPQDKTPVYPITFA